MTLSTWSAAVDYLVNVHPQLGMDLAHARVAVVDLVTDAGDPVSYLQVKARADTIAWLRGHRRESEAYILQALLGFGCEFEACGFVEEWIL